MGLPVAPVDIVNLALDQLGQAPIASIDPPDDIEAARIMARQYDHARTVVLRSFVWNFAKARTTISRSGTPAFDYPDKYTLPNGFVRLLSIDGNSSLVAGRDYDIEGKSVLYNASGATSIKLRYIQDIPDVTQWDALFRDVVILTLAKNTAFAITKQKAMTKHCNDQLIQILPDAVSIDGQEVPPKRIQRSRLIDGRRSVGSTNVASPWTTFGA